MGFGFSERLQLILDVDGAAESRADLLKVGRAVDKLDLDVQDLDTSLRHQGASFGYASNQAVQYAGKLRMANQAAAQTTATVAASGGLTSSLKAVGGLMGGTMVVAAARGALALGKIGAQAEDLDNAFKSLGGTSGTLERARDTLRGTVDDGTIRRMFNLAKAFQLTENQFQGLLPVAKKMSQVMALDMNEAVERLVTGIGKLEVELLDELGIGFKLTDAYNEYAKTLGKTANELSTVEQRTAALVKLQKEAGRTIKDIDLDAAADGYNRLAASITNVKATLGRGVNRRFDSLLDSSADAVDRWRQIMEVGARNFDGSIINVREAVLGLEEFDNATEQAAMGQQRLKQTLMGNVATLRAYKEQYEGLLAAERESGNLDGLKRWQVALAGINKELEKTNKQIDAITKRQFPEAVKLVEDLEQGFDKLVPVARVLGATVTGEAQLFNSQLDGWLSRLDKATSKLQGPFLKALTQAVRPMALVSGLAEPRKKRKRGKVDDEILLDRAAEAARLQIAQAAQFVNQDGLSGFEALDAREKERQRIREFFRKRREKNAEEQAARERDELAASKRRKEREESQGGQLFNQFDVIGAFFANTPAKMEGFRAELAKTLDYTVNFAAVGKQAIMGFSDAFAGSVEQAIVNGQRFDKAMGEVFGGFIISLGRMAMQQGAYLTIVGTLSSFIPALAPIGGGAAGVAGGAALLAFGAGAMAVGSAMGGGRSSGLGGGRSRGGGADGGVPSGASSVPGRRQTETTYNPTFVIGVSADLLTDTVITVSDDRAGLHGARRLNVIQE